MGLLPKPGKQTLRDGASYQLRCPKWLGMSQTPDPGGAALGIQEAEILLNCAHLDWYVSDQKSTTHRR